MSTDRALSDSVMEIVELFETEIELLPERKGNRMNASLDVEKAKLLGWRVERSVEDDYIRAFATRATV